MNRTEEIILDQKEIESTLKFFEDLSKVKDVNSNGSKKDLKRISSLSAKSSEKTAGKGSQSTLLSGKNCSTNPLSSSFSSASRKIANSVSYTSDASIVSLKSVSVSGQSSSAHSTKTEKMNKEQQDMENEISFSDDFEVDTELESETVISSERGSESLCSGEGKTVENVTGRKINKQNVKVKEVTAYKANSEPIKRTRSNGLSESKAFSTQTITATKKSNKDLSSEESLETSFTDDTLSDSKVAFKPLEKRNVYLLTDEDINDILESRHSESQRLPQTSSEYNRNQIKSKTPGGSLPRIPQSMLHSVSKKSVKAVYKCPQRVNRKHAPESIRLPNIPRVLKSDAVYHNGGIHIQVQGLPCVVPENSACVRYELPRSSLPLPVTLLFTAGKSQQSPKKKVQLGSSRTLLRKSSQSPVDRDVLETRAAWPPFNTKLDVNSDFKLKPSNCTNKLYKSSWNRI